MKHSLLNIWGDVVETKALIFCIFLIGVTTMGAHLLAPSDNETLGLFFGIGGAVIGFIITVFLFKPQRIIHEQERD